MENRSKQNRRYVNSHEDSLISQARAIAPQLWHEIDDLIRQAQLEATRDKLKWIQCEKRLRDER